jgi:hypothetical protein
VLIVRVNAPAVDGRANVAVIEAVAKAFGVKRREVDVVAGAVKPRELVYEPSAATVFASTKLTT